MLPPSSPDYIKPLTQFLVFKGERAEILSYSVLASGDVFPLQKSPIPSEVFIYTCDLEMIWRRRSQIWLLCPVMSMLSSTRARAQAPAKFCLAFSRMGFSHGDLFFKKFLGMGWVARSENHYVEKKSQEPTHLKLL